MKRFWIRVKNLSDRHSEWFQEFSDDGSDNLGVLIQEALERGDEVVLKMENSPIENVVEVQD